jgi:hypothetical protein
MVGKNTTSVVLEYSGVDSRVTVLLSYSYLAPRCTWAQRMPWPCTMPLGSPVVPDE